MCFVHAFIMIKPLKALMSIFTQTWHYYGCVQWIWWRHFTEKPKHRALKITSSKTHKYKKLFEFISQHSISVPEATEATYKYTEVDCQSPPEMFKIVLFLALFSISLSVVSSVGSYCPYLSYPSYGYIATSRGYVYGSVATYSCRTGYYLHGNARRICLNSGVWGGIAPTCCKLIHYV